MDSIKEEKKLLPKDDEIDLRIILKRILRRKFVFISITSIATLTNIIFTAFETPIYKGSFEIIVGDKSNKQGNLKSFSSELLSYAQLGLGNFDENNNETQEFILKSPSVLLPVFEFAKREYRRRGENTKKLSYKSWVKKKLSIEFVESTNVLDIDFIDSDKEFILDTLNIISKEYKKYSRRDREKELTRGINYLTSQRKELKRKAIDSQKKLNVFSIENGLGDIDGFVSLGSNKINNLNLSDIGNLESLPSNLKALDGASEKRSEAGQRFSNQFRLLEIYESDYTNYSSKLKPNSRLLKELKIKIENLRSALKRPNEILIKYNELVKISTRDEKLLNNVEDQISLYKLEKARQEEPWELISTPTIDDNRVSPLRKQSALLTILVSSLIASLICIYIDYKTGIVYEFEELKAKIKCNFLNTLYPNNPQLNSKIIVDLFNNPSANKFYLIDATKLHNLNALEFIDFKNTLSKYSEVIKFDKKINLENYDNLAFIVNEGSLTNEDIIFINQYAKILKDKLVGWFYLESKIKL